MRQSTLRLLNLSVSWLALALSGCAALGFVPAPAPGADGSLETLADVAREREAVRAKTCKLGCTRAPGR